MSFIDHILHIPSRINKNMMNGALFATFSFINRGFSFLLLLILANYIAPVEYGYLSLFSTVLMVIGYFIAFSTEGYFSLVYLRDGIEDSKKVYTNILLTSVIMLVFFTLILVSTGNFLPKALSLPKHTIYLAVITGFFTVFINTNLEYYRIQEKVKTYGILSCSNALLNFVTSIILVKSLNQGWEGRVYAITSCSIIYGLYALIFFLKKNFIKNIDTKIWKQMLIWGIPLIPHLASNFIKQGGDRYIINYFHSIEDVGIFSFALNLTTVITMIGFGFNQSNSVSIYKICGDKKMPSKQKEQLLLRQRRIYLLLYTGASVLVVILCMLFIPILLPKYSESIVYMPLLGLYGMLVCYYLVYTNYLFFYNKTKELMYVTVSTAVIHLLLSLLLTRYSLFLTCAVYCISQFLIVFFVRTQSMKALHQDLVDY